MLLLLNFNLNSKKIKIKIILLGFIYKTYEQKIIIFKNNLNIIFIYYSIKNYLFYIKICKYILYNLKKKLA